MHEPVQCPTCHEEFMGMRALTSHRRSDHPKPLECEQCGGTFSLLHHLMRHLTTQHPVAPRQSGGEAAATAAPKNVPPPPNWRSMADPVSYTLLPEAERSPVPIYGEKWAHIPTHFCRNIRLHDWYNFRLCDLQPVTVSRYLNAIFRDQQTTFKLNLSFGFLLRNQETGGLRYYHASANNHLAFPAPFIIRQETDLQQVKDALNWNGRGNNATIANGWLNKSPTSPSSWISFVAISLVAVKISHVT